MTDANDDNRRLRRQRNWALAIAILLVLGAEAAVFPVAMTSQHLLRDARDQLLELQQSLLAVQQQTRDCQASILRAQKEIENLRKGSR